MSLGAPTIGRSAPADKVQRQDHARTGDAKRRPRVLLIDDNATVLDLYTLVLQRDADVLTATRGEAGYTIACLQHPDVIVVDVVMPDVDGLDLCERLLANPQTATIPLIVLTGDERAFARAEEMRQLDGVLKKPCTIDRFFETILRAIASRAIH